MLLQRIRAAMAGILIMKILSELCLKPAPGTREKLKNSSRRFQVEPGWISGRSCVPPNRPRRGRGAHHHIFTAPDRVFGRVLEEPNWIILGYYGGSSEGRVPKAWFDFWGLRPGLCFNLESYDVALPECGIEVIGVAVGAANF